MDRWKRLLIFVLLLACLIAYWHFTSSPLNGWWIKQSGVSDLPDEMSVSLKRNHFKMSYRTNVGDQTTVTLLLDGRGHPFSATSDFWGNVTAITYWSELKGNSLLFTKKVEHLPSKHASLVLPHLEDSWTEHWSVANDGRHLTIAIPGQQDTVYERAPIGAWLFRGSP